MDCPSCGAQDIWPDTHTIPAEEYERYPELFPEGFMATCPECGEMVQEMVEA